MYIYIYIYHSYSELSGRGKQGFLKPVGISWFFLCAAGLQTAKGAWIREPAAISMSHGGIKSAEVGMSEPAVTSTKEGFESREVLAHAHSDFSNLRGFQPFGALWPGFEKQS